MRARLNIGQVVVVALATFTALPVAPVAAIPPPGAVVGAGAIPEARWVEHRVIPGERVAEICERYGVRSQQLVKWNKLDPERIRIRAGQSLRVYTRGYAVERVRVRYKVRRGDSWSRIAKRHGVDARKLRRHWNRDMGESLRAGDHVIVWVEREAEEMQAAKTATRSTADDASSASTGSSDAGAGAVQVPAAPTGSFSVGSPSRGRLVGGIRLPDNPALYTIRKPDNSYASSHTIAQLLGSIARFRHQTGFDREIVINDISRRHGGRFRPHRSHRSGRDVDIRLPLAEGVAKGTVPLSMSQVDWGAAWALMRSMIDTGQVEYIFLSRTRQRALRDAALEAGADADEVARLIQFPDRARTALIRHSRGHVKHFHVRFRCGPADTRCR